MRKVSSTEPHPPEDKPIRKRVTVRDIAEVVGVHHTTVSLALRNSPRLRPATRKKIQEVAKRLGYVPDPMVSALNAYRRSVQAPKLQAVIAWINNWPDRAELTRIPTFREYFEGACARGHERGYLVEEFWLHEPGMTPAKLRRVLRARGIQALLMAPQPLANLRPEIDFEDFSAVAFGFSMQPADLHVVTNNQFQSMSLLLSRVFALGYRRIGIFLGLDWDEKTGNLCLAAMLLFQSKHPQVKIFWHDYQTADPFEKWLSDQKPDILVSSDSMVPVLRRLGYSIPSDIGFADLDRDPAKPHLSGIDQHNFLIGQKAVDVLVGMLHRSERGVPEVPTRILVESSWAAGETLLEKTACKRRRRTPQGQGASR